MSNRSICISISRLNYFFSLFFSDFLWVELLHTTKKDHTSLAVLAWWFDGCISYLGMSVKPPLKSPSFEKMVLCLNELNYKGGLTTRHNFRNLVILGNFVTLE